MSKVVLATAYFGNIQYYSAWANAESVLLETHENFQKQSYRNRCAIYGANGLLNLIIPIKRTGVRSGIQNVAINNEERWQKLHWKSLESAYRSSPYFEYYENRLKEVFSKSYESLFDFNLDCHNVVLEILDLPSMSSTTEEYKESYDAEIDLRSTIHPKVVQEMAYPQRSYNQVFEDRFGYIPNLSILDLIFNEGPNAISYLRDH